MKSVFGFRVRLGDPDLDFENLNPDFPIERTLIVYIVTRYMYDAVHRDFALSASFVLRVF